MTALVAIAASTALPPGSGACTPARAAGGWLAATMPNFVAIFDRPTTTRGAGEDVRRGAEGFCWPMTPTVRATTDAVATSAERMLMSRSPRLRVYLIVTKIRVPTARHYSAV